MPPPAELRNRPQDGISWIQKVAAVELGFLAPYLIVWAYVGIYRRKEYVSGATGGPRGWRARPLPCGPPAAPPTYYFLLYIPTYPQTIRTGAKNLIPPLQPSVSTRSHLGACFGAPPEEGRHHGGLLHHPSPSDEV